LRSHNDILTYQRFTDTEHLTVALNLTDEARRLNCADGNVVFSTHLDRQDLRIVGSLLLRPDQGVIIRTAQGHATYIGDDRYRAMDPMIQPSRREYLASIANCSGPTGWATNSNDHDKIGRQRHRFQKAMGLLFVGVIAA